MPQIIYKVYFTSTYCNSSKHWSMSRMAVRTIYWYQGKRARGSLCQFEWREHESFVTALASPTKQPYCTVRTLSALYLHVQFSPPATASVAYAPTNLVQKRHKMESSTKTGAVRKPVVTTTPGGVVGTRFWDLHKVLSSHDNTWWCCLYIHRWTAGEQVHQLTYHLIVPHLLTAGEL